MSATINNPPSLEHLVTSGFAARAIGQKARQLAGQRGFSLSEREDIEQELRLHLLRRLAKFDPQVAPWNVFVRTLVERHAATLVMRRRSQLRLADRCPPPSHSAEVDIDAALDTAMLLADLPCRAREICERLKNDTIAEVARQMGLPRSTLRGEITRLRGHFRTVGRAIPPRHPGPVSNSSLYPFPKEPRYGTS